MATYVKVKFLSEYDSGASQGYFYSAGRLKLSKYDTVIVPTRYGLSLAVVQQSGLTIEEVREHINCQSLKTVAERITSKAVNELTKLQKVDDIKKALDKEMKKVDEVEKYRMYADISPEIKTLLEQLQEMKA